MHMHLSVFATFPPKLLFAHPVFLTSLCQCLRKLTNFDVANSEYIIIILRASEVAQPIIESDAGALLEGTMQLSAAARLLPAFLSSIISLLSFTYFIYLF